jgi:phosphatidylinositol glycan class O
VFGLLTVLGVVVFFPLHFFLLCRLRQRYPDRTALFRFRADPPTTTLQVHGVAWLFCACTHASSVQQRLKSLASGTLPTVVEAGQNFGAKSVVEDSWLRQAKQLGRNISFMGDDTWVALFPGLFAAAAPFPSFVVHDLHTVDSGVTALLVPLLSSNASTIDIVVAHYLGVDHCGHTHGSVGVFFCYHFSLNASIPCRTDHPAMAAKLNEMNAVLSDIVLHLPADVALIVLGDHGMTRSGDHGGGSELELDAALFVFFPTPRPILHGVCLLVCLALLFVL